MPAKLRLHAATATLVSLAAVPRSRPRSSLMRSWLVAGIVAFGLAVAFLVSSASARATPLLGFNDGWVQRSLYDPSASAADFAHMDSHLARVTYDWNDRHDKANIQPTLNAMHADGIDTIITPYDNDGPVANPNKTYQTKLCSEAKNIAAANPGSPIEILNEVNLSSQGDFTPTEYATLFKACSDKIRKAGLNSRILPAAVSMVPCNSSGENWLDDFASQVRDYSFTISVHVYLGGCWGWTSDPAAVPRLIIAQTRNAPGYADRDLWVTEVGYSSGSLRSDESAQNTWLGGYIHELVLESGDQHIDRVYVHRLYDVDPTDNSWDGRWGIKRAPPSGDSWKPVADTILSEGF